MSRMGSVLRSGDDGGVVGQDGAEALGRDHLEDGDGAPRVRSPS
jgi:hypothetical protein